MRLRLPAPLASLVALALLRQARGQVEQFVGTCANVSAHLPLPGVTGQLPCYTCVTSFSLVESVACGWCNNGSTPGSCMSSDTMCPVDTSKDAYWEVDTTGTYYTEKMCLIDHCAIATTCGECTAFNEHPKIHCGWCAKKQQCMPLDSNEPDHPIGGSTCDQSSWALTPEHCSCETRTQCDTCVEQRTDSQQNGLICGWCASDQMCYARGDSRSGSGTDGPAGVVACKLFEMEACCSNGTSCGNCIDGNFGACGWCGTNDQCYSRPDKYNCSAGMKKTQCEAVYPTMAPTEVLGGPVGWTVMSLAGTTVVCCFFPALMFLMLVMMMLSKKQRKFRIEKMRKKKLTVDTHTSEVSATTLPKFIAGGGGYNDRQHIKAAQVSHDHHLASAKAARRTMRRLSNVGIEMGATSAIGGGGGSVLVSNPLTAARDAMARANGQGSAAPLAPLMALQPIQMSASPFKAAAGAAPVRRGSISHIDTPAMRRKKLNDQLLSVQLEVQSMQASKQATGQWAWHRDAAKGAHAAAHANAHRRRMSMG